MAGDLPETNQGGDCFAPFTSAGPRQRKTDGWACVMRKHESDDSGRQVCASSEHCATCVLHWKKKESNFFLSTAKPSASASKSRSAS